MTSSPLILAALDAWREIRADYELLLESAYQRANDDLAGNLLNPRGKAKHIDAYSLFMGSEQRAHAYASEELLDHWRRYPRVMFKDYERQHPLALDWRAA